MMRAGSIPKHAHVERLHLARVPAEPGIPAEHVGRIVTVALLAGERSHGLPKRL